MHLLRFLISFLGFKKLALYVTTNSYFSVHGFPSCIFPFKYEIPSAHSEFCRNKGYVVLVNRDLKKKNLKMFLLYLFVCLPVYPSTSLYIYWPVYVCMYLSAYLFIDLSTHLPVYLSLLICPFLFLTKCVFGWSGGCQGGTKWE